MSTYARSSSKGKFSLSALQYALPYQYQQLQLHRIIQLPLKEGTIVSLVIEN